MDNKHIEREIDLVRDKMEQVCDDLSSYGDTVQIFFTKYDKSTGKTYSLTSGSGNIYARRGKVSDWLIKQEQDDLEENNEY